MVNKKKEKTHIIKAELTKNTIEKLFNILIHISNVKETDKICLISLGNPYFYDLICKFHKKELIYIIEDISSQFIYLGRTDIPKENINFIDIKKIKRNNFFNMIFDKIIMNPPYDGNGNLYGKITLEAKKHANEVVCLSPYLNYLETAQKQCVKNVANLLLPNLKSYQLIDTDYFDAAFDKKLCIFHFCDNIETPADINDLYWKQFKNPRLMKTIINKIKRFSDFCFPHIINKKDFDIYKFKVAFTGVRGHCKNGVKAWDWTTILDEDKMQNFNYTSDKKEDLMGFPFKTETECQNFVNWVNDDIFGFLILIQKHSINMDKWLFKIIPYFDYTINMKHEDYCRILNLTDEEQSYIKEEMKNFGWKAQTNK